MRIASIIFTFAMAATPAVASDPAAMARFDSAVDHMESGDWQRAATALRALIDDGIVSGPILLNLATSLQHLGADGEARWALARAETVPEVSEEARRRGTVLDRRLNQPPLDHASNAPPFGWIWMTGLLIVSVSLIGAVFRPQARWGIWIGGVVVMLAIAASALPLSEPGIVVEDAVAFRNHQSLANPEMTLTEGQFVRIVSRKGARAEVQTKDGFRGWVDTYAVRTF